MSYNICVVQPDGYVHAGAFYELAELIAFGIEDCGVPCTVGLNAIDPAARNVIIGCHLLDPAMAGSLPPGTVILNTEQLHGGATPWLAAIQDWARRCAVWDYSPHNIAALQAAGVEGARFLALGHHPKLQRIARLPQDVDVLFYGSTNDRRTAVLDDLRARGLKVQQLFGVYGRPRDAWITRSRVVLNLHFYESKIFEVVRVHYLLSNGRAVVGEAGPDTLADPLFLQGICGVPYAGLADACEALVRDDAARAALEQRALATIAQRPQGPIMQALIAS